MAKLIVHHGTPQAREFELKPGSNHLGRGEANDCQITDASVSTNHADITVEGSLIRIRDLGSTNGTFINQSQVSEAVLQPGQLLRLGAVSLFLQTDAPVPPPPPAPARQPINLASQATLIQAAPVAAGASGGGGLKLSGLRHAEPEPPPPPPSETMAAPAGHGAAETEFAEPPPGKTACKFHPKIGGQWLCRKCNDLFCPICVVTRPSSEGTAHTCRKCGTACVQVRVTLTKSKEKEVVVYSDKALLMRSVGFGFGAALLGALIWTGLSWLFGFDVPFLFGPMVGALVGYAVKIACQDTPGAVFSSIAVVFCIIGCVLGKVGMIAITHLTLNTNTTYVTGGLGIGIAIYTAWKIGGAE
jgi:hypothetical protein